MITFKRGENKKLSNNFSSNEFECHCGKCDIQYIEEELILGLQKVRDKFGKPIKVTSGYRCPEHNKAIKGAANSSHTSGMAADIHPEIISLDSLDLLYDICYDVFNNIGDGRMKKKFIHVDSRPPKPTGKRTWLY